MSLDIHSEKRGEWHVVTVPAGIRVTPYTLPSKKAAQAARGALADGIPGFPWDVDKDGLGAAMKAFRAERGVSLPEAVERALAAVPAADPQGWNAGNIRSREKAAEERAAFLARENADGYTEAVKTGDIRVGDEISFRYPLFGPRRYGFTGLRDIERGKSLTVTVRARVAGEGRLMTRHGNNYDEGVDGLRFPLAGATWQDDDGNGGPLETSVTTDWLGGARRRPRKD